MDALRRLTLISAAAGVSLANFLPDDPIRVGNKSLSEDDQQKLIEKAEQKRLRKAQKRLLQTRG